MDAIELIGCGWEIKGDFPTHECDIANIFAMKGKLTIHAVSPVDKYGILVEFSPEVIPGGGFYCYLIDNAGTPIKQDIYPSAKFDVLEAWIDKQIFAVAKWEDEHPGVRFGTGKW